MQGVEAVIDKDLSAALLATALEADSLVPLKDVDAVYTDWATAEARPIRATTAAELRRKRFAAGSMRPKADAACRFVETTNCWAGIGALEDAANIVGNSAGMIIRR